MAEFELRILSEYYRRIRSGPVEARECMLSRIAIDECIEPPRPPRIFLLPEPCPDFFYALVGYVHFGITGSVFEPIVRIRTGGMAAAQMLFSGTPEQKQPIILPPACRSLMKSFEREHNGPMNDFATAIFEVPPENVAGTGDNCLERLFAVAILSDCPG